MDFRNPNAGQIIAAPHAYGGTEVGDLAKVCTLTPSRKLHVDARPAITGEAAIDSRIDEACSREHRGKVIQIFWNIIRNFVSNHATAVRARASKVPFPSFVNMHVYSVQCQNHMCIIESGIATGSWRFARRVHRGAMRT